ncbi:MAG TPA: hypothetical protein ENK72_02735 [Epsilonproteobacteria bacterium]|nr:hypothetical protein [Campylobacterota bacterium]
MNTLSISEIQRNLHKLDEFDIIEVVDKKRHQVKGYFLDKKYHDKVMELLKEKEATDDIFDKTAGILKGKNIDPVKWQREIREEWEREWDI